ncbi:hypothetical protein FIBSPDRAFT_900335 [Athelia psychrophila]|uniref:Uncharacterized protein n=1 Tax=Athelia psychrophila TaxID=1759441 RepID=A0A165YKK9_9AGAM|nr:hypothetical protein FIBSPDRAFT_900335 [Fibularhizoctonia sp. CBS 109695]
MYLSNSIITVNPMTRKSAGSLISNSWVSKVEMNCYIYGSAQLQLLVSYPAVSSSTVPPRANLINYWLVRNYVTHCQDVYSPASGIDVASLISPITALASCQSSGSDGIAPQWTCITPSIPLELHQDHRSIAQTIATIVFWDENRQWVSGYNDELDCVTVHEGTQWEHKRPPFPPLPACSPGAVPMCPHQNQLNSVASHHIVYISSQWQMPLPVMPG